MKGLGNVRPALQLVQELLTLVLPTTTVASIPEALCDWQLGSDDFNMDLQHSTDNQSEPKRNQSYICDQNINGQLDDKRFD